MATAPWEPVLSLPDTWRPHVSAHPTPLVESVNLAATPPPTGWAAEYHPVTVPRGLSYAQAEAALLAIRACSHTTGGGFCLGDATGVGKGRTLAAVALERTAARGAVCVWVTTSTALFGDAERDLRAVCGAAQADELLHVASGASRVIRVTYRQLSYDDTFTSIVRQLQAAGPHGTLLFDESHIARTVASGAQSKTAVNVLRLQRSAPHAAVVYSSATPVSEVQRIGCMERLGLWPAGTGDTTFGASHFADIMTARGPAAMELVALHLKRRGLYVARQLPPPGEGVRSVACVLTPAQRELYDRCAHFWTMACAPPHGTRLHTRQQAFFRRFITALKVPTLIRRARAHLAAGLSVIVTLQSTGDAAQQRGGAHGALGDDIRRAASALGLDPGAIEADLIASLPGEPIDAVVDALRSYGLVELSGRSRPNAVARGVEEFQAGRARVAVVTTAGSHGLSLHDVGQCDNGVRRAHLLLELPWSAEAFVQQCGRSSRTGQRSAPLYELLVSDVPAESRFSLAVWQRLQSMGALTRGDRNTEYTALSALGSHSESEHAAPVRTIARMLMCRATRGALQRRAPELLPERSPPRCTCRGRRGRRCELCLEVVSAMHECPEPRLHDARTVETKHGVLGQMLSVVAEYGGLDSCPEPLLRASAAALGPAERSACGVNMVTAEGAQWPGLWTPGMHDLFPADFRARVRCLLLCAGRPGPLGALPTEALYMIIEQMSHSELEARGTDAEAHLALRHLLLQNGQSLAWFTQNLTTTRLLNTMMAMPVGLQSVLYKITRQAAGRAQRARSWRGGDAQLPPCSVDTFVTGPGVHDMRVRVALGRQDGRGARPLRVAVTHAPQPDPVQGADPAVAATGVTARGTLIVALLRDGAYHGYLPGRARVASDRSLSLLGKKLRCVHWDEDGSVERDDVWLAEWTAQRDAYHARRVDTARRLAARHLGMMVATDAALEMWSLSQGQVLRCTPPVSETAFTCLVLDPRKLGTA